MARKTLLIVAAMMTLSLIAYAAAKPNFSGSWTMDRGRSFGLPGDMNQTLTVSQKDNLIEVETKLIQPNNERTVKDTYTLDGKEYDFTPPVPPNAPPAKGKRTAVWLPGDRGIQVTDVTTAETPKGPVTTQTVRKWTMSSDGELVIDMYVDNPNISYEAKRIFIKK
ncbi:MAG TPA: hypothetical protein VFI24_05010 [Pyrinomonadaceae bacterium]|nr:hypothetical protein [Pyrinomonadaceae bacterium]